MSSKHIKSFVTFYLERDATTIETKEKQQILRDTKNLSLLFIFLSCFYLRTFSSNDNKTSFTTITLLLTYIFCAQWTVYWNITPNYSFFPFLILQAEFVQQLKTCDAIIVMYSLTDRISFHVAREILDDLANLGSVVCPVLLLANKMDLCQHRKVNLKKIKNFQSSAYTNPTNFLVKLISKHGLRTPNEGINQRYLKNWADVADKICCRHT